MPRFAANLSLMFTEWDFLDRFDAAAEAGFAAVEFLFPYAVPADRLAERLRRNELALALFNAPPGDLEAGDRGLAARPDRAEAFRQSIGRALEYAATLGGTRIHVMAGRAEPGDAEAAATFRRSLGWAAERFAGQGVDLLVEPLNARDNPGYFLVDFGAAEGFVRGSGQPNVKLQFDVYHRQILHGDVATALRRLLPIVGHMQIASVPSRHEPDSEELNLAFLAAEIDRLGYDGYVGCEYRPARGTLAGLGWFAPYRRAPDGAFASQLLARKGSVPADLDLEP